MITYAIGDIHGCVGRFLALLNKIGAHAKGREHRIITLGDYIDRGSDSKTVLDVLMARPDIIALTGNHEQMMLNAAFARSLEHEESWLMNGGHATLASFDIEERHPRIAKRVPENYLAFIAKNLRWYFEDERRYFVHAGIPPYVKSIADASQEDLIWIRDVFLRHHGRFPKYVVHGHTPQISGEPDVKHNRVNVDTFCYKTGILTAAVFTDDQDEPVEFLQTQRMI